MLPHFNVNFGIFDKEPLFNNLFEVKLENLPDELVYEIISYKLDTISNRIDLKFNINISNISLISHNLYPKKILITNYDKNGVVYRKYELSKFAKFGFIHEGDYNNEKLTIIKCSWLFEDILIDDISREFTI